MRITKSTKVIIIFCGLIMAAAAAAEKQGYYRWVDDNGEVNFTQKPPMGRPSEFVLTKTGTRIPVSDEEATAEENNDQSSQAADADTQPQPQKMKILPEKDPERCEQGKKALQALSNKSKRVRVIDDQGEARVLGPEELEEQRRRAQEMVDLHC